MSGTLRSDDPERIDDLPPVEIVKKQVQKDTTVRKEVKRLAPLEGLTEKCDSIEKEK